MLFLCWYYRGVCIHLGCVESSPRSGIALKHVSVGSFHHHHFLHKAFSFWCGVKDDGVVANFVYQPPESVRWREVRQCWPSALLTMKKAESGCLPSWNSQRSYHPPWLVQWPSDPFKDTTWSFNLCKSMVIFELPFSSQQRVRRLWFKSLTSKSIIRLESFLLENQSSLECTPSSQVPLMPFTPPCKVSVFHFIYKTFGIL